MQNGLWFMVFKGTFNNISVILWQSVLLVEEMEYPEKTTDKLYYIMLYGLHLVMSGIRCYNFTGDRH